MSMPETTQDKVRALKEEFGRAVRAVADSPALQALQDRFLGRKSGELTGLLKSLGTMAPEFRKQIGGELNALKVEIEGQIAEARAKIEERRKQERLRSERVDITLPGRPAGIGRRHPPTAVREQLESIFVSMGYEVYDSREVEDDYHCFEAVNMPPDHPAREMQDTFYIDGGPGVLLRTHTSAAQIRYMLGNTHPPDVRIICPGKVFRRDSDITHSPMFHQIEGLVVGEGITLGHLKGTIEAFLHALFGPQYPVRFRNSFFPYTEPSVEVDLGCIVCGGSGRLGGDTPGPCRVCKTTGWVEILGSGMVPPAVFEAVNGRLGRKVYDPDVITGFAFGLGIERVAMIRHGVDDIRLFFEGDLRFLEQFEA
jgi:phenylalanyl-tRNA synthetase alpha chain